MWYVELHVYLDLDPINIWMDLAKGPAQGHT